MNTHPFSRIRVIVMHPAFFLLVLALLLVLGRAVARELSANLKLRRELAKLKAEVAELEGKSQTLAGQFEALQRPLAVEYEARLKYGLRRVGERVLIVPEDASTKEQEEGEEAKTGQRWLKNLRAWWKYFVRD